MSKACLILLLALPGTALPADDEIDAQLIIPSDKQSTGPGSEFSVELPLPTFAPPRARKPETDADRFDVDWEHRSQQYVDFILNPSKSRWHAYVINVAGNAIVEEGEDYATGKYNDTWDFDENDYEGIDEFRGIPSQKETDDDLFQMESDLLLVDTDTKADINPAASGSTANDTPEKGGLKVENGILSFTTEKGACFFWGNHFGNKPEYGRERINASLLKIRVRQSDLVSKWTVTMRSTGATRSRGVNEQFVIEGHGWQTKNVPLNGGIGTSFCIQPGHEDNSIQIDWIKLVPCRLAKHFRKTFILDDSVRDTRFCAKSEGGYQVFVNGKEAFRPRRDRFSSSRVDLFDLKDHLVKGKNVIAVRAPTHLPHVKQAEITRHFFLEGAVITTSGQVHRMYTDRTWKASYAAQPGWEQPGYDDSNWKPAKPRGKASSPQATGYIAFSDSFVNPPYMGPIGIMYPDRSAPIYGIDERVALDIVLPKRTYTPAPYVVKFRIDHVTDEFDQHEVHSGTASRGHARNSDLVFPVTFETKQAGAYELLVTVEEQDGTVIDTRRDEFAIVGPTDQEAVDGTTFEEGMGLKLVHSIDCTEKTRSLSTAGSYSDTDTKSIPTEIIETDFGKYRQLKTSAGWSRMIYTITVDRPGKVHLVEIEYPDDAKRSLIAWLSEYPLTEDKLKHQDYRRSSVCIYTGGRVYKPTHSMRKVKLLYWPRKRNATLDLYNLQQGCRVAAAHIRVFEITSGLPALRIPHPVPGRTLGGHSERDTVLIPNFYPGLLGAKFGHMCMWPRRRFYYDWYVTLDNFTRYMKFCGQNVYVTGTYMYEKALYPTDTFGNGNIVRKDHRPLMAKMFEYNGIDTILGVQLSHSRPFYSRDKFSNSDVRAGSRTIKLVSRDGRQAYNSLTKAGFNWLLPEVQSVAVDILKELVTCYKEYPSVKGLTFITGPQCHYPVFTFLQKNEFGGLDFGYGDLTIARFEKDTGMKIPVGPGPDRFEKRYQWLMSNAKSDWVDWRCKTMQTHIAQAVDTVKSIRPDHNISVVSILPERKDYRAWQSGKISYRDACKARGIDPLPLAHKHQLMHYIFTRQATDWSQHTLLSERYRKQLKEKSASYGNHPVGAYFSRGVAPHGFGMIPGSAYGAIDHAKMLCCLTPVSLIHGKADTMYMQGSEQKLRSFARSYRSLPAGEYVDLPVDGENGTIFARELSAPDNYCFYVVNMAYQPQEVSISLKTSQPQSRCIDLVSGKPVGTGHPLKIEVMPFDVRAVTCHDAGARVKQISVNAPR